MLTIPTNWDDRLIGMVDRGSVCEFYGKLSSDFLGGGRASYVIPQVSRAKAEAHIRKVRDAGFSFNYLLNATCLDNREWTAGGQRKIRALLRWLSRMQVDTVTVAVPYVLELARECLPGVKICVSTSARVNTVERAVHWEKLGADIITPDSVSVNRDFTLLRAMRKAVGCRLQLIANVNCLLNCALRNYHCAGISHASQAGHACRGFFVDYSYLTCSKARVSDPVNLLKGDWIRPEDLGVYETLGIDRFKLVDRNMPTDVIAGIARAYARRRYDGNLMDLFPTPKKSLMTREFGFFHKFRYFFRPFSVNPFRMRRAQGLTFDIFSIDNRALDGFIGFFLTHDCSRMSCEECGYCRDTAAKAVRFDPAQREELAARYRQFLDELSGGTVFSYRTA